MKSGQPRSTPDPMIGRVLGERYRIAVRIGAGGMGTVYRALQLSVDREVAVKLLRPDLSADETAVARFESEARIISKLRHPNTVRLVDFGRTDDGYVYAVTELLHGSSLAEELKRCGRIEAVRALQILAQIAGSLSEAHAKGIVHRDIKPANIFLEKIGDAEVARVLDFGIAKLSGSKRTETGMLLGTPGYMSPEQASLGTIDAKSDLYSMGVLAYECLTGRLPIEAPSTMLMLMKTIQEPPLPFRIAAPQLELPPGVATIVMQLLAKRPEDRPSSAADVEAKVGRLLNVSKAAAAPRRSRVAIGVALGFALILVAIAVVQRAGRSSGVAPSVEAAVAKKEPPLAVLPTSSVARVASRSEEQQPEAREHVDAGVVDVAPDPITPAGALEERARKQNAKLEVPCETKNPCVVIAELGNARLRMEIDPKRELSWLNREAAARAGYTVRPTSAIQESMELDLARYPYRDNMALVCIWKQVYARDGVGFIAQRAGRTFVLAELTRLHVRLGGAGEDVLVAVPVLDEAHESADGVLGASFLDRFDYDVDGGVLRFSAIDAGDEERYGGRGVSWWRTQLGNMRRRQAALDTELADFKENGQAIVGRSGLVGLDRVQVELARFFTAELDRLSSDAQRFGAPRERINSSQLRSSSEGW